MLVLIFSMWWCSLWRGVQCELLKTGASTNVLELCQQLTLVNGLVVITTGSAGCNSVSSNAFPLHCIRYCSNYSTEVCSSKCLPQLPIILPFSEVCKFSLFCNQLEIAKFIRTILPTIALHISCILLCSLRNNLLDIPVSADIHDSRSTNIADNTVSMCACHQCTNCTTDAIEYRNFLS